MEKFYIDMCLGEVIERGDEYLYRDEYISAEETWIQVSEKMIGLAYANSYIDMRRPCEEVN